MFQTRKKSKKSFLDGIFGGQGSNVATAMGGNGGGKLNANKELLMSLLEDEDSDGEKDFDIEMFKPNLREEDTGFDFGLGQDEDEFEKKKKKKKPKKKKLASVKIEPVISNVEAYGEAPHEHLLRPPFSLLVIAPKGSGKTTTTINLLKWYEGMFDNRIAFSPTMVIDDNWKTAFIKGTIKKFNRRNTFKHYHEEKLCKIWKAIKKENKGKEMYADKLKTMILFDDIVGELPRTRDNCCYKIARNHRHYAVSNIVISQEYTGLAPVLRKNATGLLLYGTTDGAEIKTITEQQGGFIGKNRFFRMWAYCISKPYGFLFINKDQKDKHRYYCYFEEELNPMDFSNERVKDMVEELEIALGKNKGQEVLPDRESKDEGKRTAEERDNDGDETRDKELQDGDKTIKKDVNGDGKKEDVVPDVKDDQLHVCHCKMAVIKDISTVCNNGLNLICNALDIDVDGMSKEDMIEELKGYKTSVLKRVLLREKKKLGQKDLK